jgi:CRP/FNR family transcriptional regulator
MIENLHLPAELIGEIEKNVEIIKVPQNTIIVSKGDKMSFLPFVSKGSVRVYIENEDVDKEKLLYYLGEGQTCLMSMIASLSDKRSQVSAITETTCDKNFRDWQKKYSEWNDFIIQLFMGQYQSLLETVDELSFKKIDERLLNYLSKNKDADGVVDIKKSHLDIANDLATSREVITRALKKLIVDRKIKKIGTSAYTIL